MSIIDRFLKEGTWDGYIPNGDALADLPTEGTPLDLSYLVGLPDAAAMFSGSTAGTATASTLPITCITL